MTLRLGTRGSRLALVQAEGVAGALRARGVEVVVEPIKTSGDRLATAVLADFGGKGLFVKEIEEALADGRIDVGVHSLKDVPASLPDGMALGAFPRREDPRDALVTRGGGGLAELPAGAVIGTSSPRRRALLIARRADLRVEPIRGNVDTRLAKLAGGACEALVLARAGLARLGLSLPHAVDLDPEDFVPAGGQGLLGLEIRADDRRTREALAALEDPAAAAEARAERAFLQELGAGCHTPVGAFARARDGGLRLSAFVASAAGSDALRSSIAGPASAAEALGRTLADQLLDRGARALLAASGDRV